MRLTNLGSRQTNLWGLLTGTQIDESVLQALVPSVTRSPVQLAP